MKTSRPQAATLPPPIGTPFSALRRIQTRLSPGRVPPSLILLAIFVTSLIQIPLVLAVSPTIIRGDGVGYYAYLRSIFFDQDLDFTNEYQHFAALLPADSQPVTSDYLRSPQTSRGLPDNPWAMGTALLWSPFFLIGHGVARMSSWFGGTVAADGYTLPYQISIAVGSALYGFLGLLIIFHLSARFFRPRPGLLAACLVWFGTSLTAYMYFIPSMSHAVSFFCVSLFIAQWIQTRGERGKREWLLLGITAGLMIAQRVQNSVFLVVLVVEFLANRKTLHLARNSAQRAISEAALFSFPVLLLFSPQLLVWHHLYGKLVPNVYQVSTGLSFDWLHPQVGKVLFSSHHGLISWTPLVLFSLAGLAIMFKVRKERLLVAGLLAAFLLQLYMVSSWPGWHQGASFGSRMFVSSSGLFILGLAGLFDWLSRRLAWRWLILGGVTLVAWNYALLFQYGTGIITRHGPVVWSQVIENAIALVRLVVSLPWQAFS